MIGVTPRDVKWPRISVITPSYNQGRFLEETLRSVIDQGYPNLEYIVLDGGSTDGSKDTIETFADQIDFWRSEPDGGQTHALVEGFSRATGEILSWLNSDDVFEPRTLWEVATFFKENRDARCVYGDAILINEFGERIRPKKEHSFSRFIFLYDHNFVPQPSTFWRHDLYEDVGGLDPRYNIAMDADLILRFSEITKIHHRRAYWSRMRQHPGAKTWRTSSQARTESRELRRKYVADQSQRSIRSRRRLARWQRVTRKLFSGCYWW